MYIHTFATKLTKLQMARNARALSVRVLSRATLHNQTEVLLQRRTSEQDADKARENMSGDMEGGGVGARGGGGERVTRKH